MEEDEFANIGPSWIGNLAFDIRDNTAQPDDVELMMAYYCHLYQSSEGIPLKPCTCLLSRNVSGFESC